MEAGASDVSGLPGVRAGAGILLGSFLLALASVLCIALLFGGAGCASATAAWSQQAEREIPRRYLALYEAAGARFRISPFFLAAIGWIESRHGRDPAAFVVNSSGCVGPMELGVGGACGDFVGRYGIDADGDGRVDPTDPADAIFTAANGLRRGGLPPLDEATLGDYRRAACGYYGACAGYADAVLARAVVYGGPHWLSAAAASACALERRSPARCGSPRGRTFRGSRSARRRSTSCAGSPRSSATRSRSPPAPTTPSTRSTGSSPTTSTATRPTSGSRRTAASEAAIGSAPRA